jgi:hypothetical protein
MRTGWISRWIVSVTFCFTFGSMLATPSVAASLQKLTWGNPDQP